MLSPSLFLFLVIFKILHIPGAVLALQVEEWVINGSRTVRSVLCWVCHVHFSDFTSAPKKSLETFIRQYHSWGFSNPKILDALKEHYDTNIYGLGSVVCFSGRDVTNRLE